MAELARLRAAITAAGDIVYEWDLASDTLTWHGDVASLFAGAPACGEALNTHIHPEDLPRRLETLSAHMSSGDSYDCEYRLRGPDGEFHWVHDRGAVDAVNGGASLRLVGTLRLVTRRKNNEAWLEYLAHYDELTGHFNKTRLLEALDQAIAEAARFEGAGGFVVFGLDQLAMVNSAYGHEVGDAVLVEVGRRLDSCLRASDVIGRISGDRYGAVLARCDQRVALRAAERAVHEVRRTPIDTPAGPIRVTVSAGVATFPDQANAAFDVMAKAESGLRTAKQHGRNCAGLFEMSEAQRREYRASMDIGAEVQQALKDGRLGFAFQPIVQAGGHEVQWWECLLRLHRQNGEVVAAGRFVPVIEQLGLMRAVDRKVLDLAVEELKAHPTVELAINISGLTASDRSWLRALTGKLKGRDDVARRLLIEITETAALRDIEESARFVRTVRELGCRVALDDFGAGYTTFRHLKALTVDVVKIDGSFVREIESAPHNRLFIRNLLQLARSLNVSAVAECVETGEVARILAEEGADLLQGWHFGKPTLERPWTAAGGPNGGKVIDFARLGNSAG